MILKMSHAAVKDNGQLRLWAIVYFWLFLLTHFSFNWVSGFFFWVNESFAYFEKVGKKLLVFGYLHYKPNMLFWNFRWVIPQKQLNILSKNSTNF